MAKNVPFWRVFENLKLAVKLQNSNVTFRVIFKQCGPFFWLSQNTVVALALGNCCPCPEALLFNQVEEIARENEGAQKN